MITDLTGHDAIIN